MDPLSSEPQLLIEVGPAPAKGWYGEHTDCSHTETYTLTNYGVERLYCLLCGQSIEQVAR